MASLDHEIIIKWLINVDSTVRSEYTHSEHKINGNFMNIFGVENI